MIPNKYPATQVRRLEDLLDYVSFVEKNIFNIKDLKKLTEKQIYDRYNLAKETLSTEVDSSLKVIKAKQGVDPETDMLLNIINSLTPDEKKQLKEKLLELKHK